MFGSEAAVNRGGIKSIPKPFVTVYNGGNYTHTLQADTTVFSVECIGAGGNGGNGTLGTNTRPCGGGGAYAQREFDRTVNSASVFCATGSSADTRFVYDGIDLRANGGSSGDVNNLVRAVGGEASVGDLNIPGSYGLRVECAMVNGLTPSTGRSALSPVGCATQDGTAGAGGPGAETYGGERVGAQGMCIVKEWAL